MAGETLGGLKLSAPPDNLAGGDAFAWQTKRSRWGVVSQTGETLVVALNSPIEQVRDLP